MKINSRGSVIADVIRKELTRQNDVNLAQSIHTAARRYCSEQFNYWATQYSAIWRAGRDRAADRYHYTPEALGVFPRYNVLKAIRVEIERIDPNELDDLADTRELLLLAGAAAEDDFTRKPIGEIDANAMADERDKFSDFIRGLSEFDLRSVSPLPYQRVLSESEPDALWTRFRNRWQIANGYWFPLAGCTLPDVTGRPKPATDGRLKTSHFESQSE